jgi:cobalt-precorrin 5A hydrolase/precorrin-3B C17-methyltransferase
MSTPSTIFITLTQKGSELARDLASHVPGSQLHGLEGRVENADLPFGSVGDHVRGLYRGGHPVIGIFSTGIMIRILADCLTDKHDGPPVLCIAEDGSAVVPLLGGHHGANALARDLAQYLDAKPAITTAGETSFGLALDDPPSGWRAGKGAKDIMAALLAGKPVRLVNDLGPAIDTAWLTASGAAFTEDDTPCTLRLTDREVPAAEAEFCLYPQTLTLGIGCERGASFDEISQLVTAALKEAALAPQSIACIATLDLKEDEAAIRAVAKSLDVPLRLFTAARLEAETPRLANPSETVFNAVGCHGVAEAAALAAGGTAARLIVPKQKSARATCAIARLDGIVHADAVGQPPGSLAIIGIGPGAATWRTPEATNVIAQATDLVAYRLYLDLVGDLVRSKNIHGYDLGEERDRCAEALDLAATGKKVALLSSGDAGIYAMASLVFELVDRSERADWKRLDIQVMPGISALQAAAARAGAPLGHDFCAISLSDLLTPWEIIEKRLHAAAAGDFVVALYNPVSKRRTKQLMQARDILLAARGTDTPVILARNLGRTDENLDIITLGDLHSDRVDMLTLVMIGSSATRIIEKDGQPPRIYTPRGYERKDQKS